MNVAGAVALTSSSEIRPVTLFEPLFARPGAANEQVMREVDDKSVKNELDRMDFIVMRGVGGQSCRSYRK
jgi:hypothetical protein